MVTDSPPLRDNVTFIENGFIDPHKVKIVPIPKGAMEADKLKVLRVMQAGKLKVMHLLWDQIGMELLFWPIMVDQDYEVISGICRVAFARQKNVEQISFQRYNFPTEEDKIRYLPHVDIFKK